MSDPRGYNPIGESAPGLPRHDAPLPGHVPGQQTLIPTEDHPPMPAGTADPGFSMGCGVWFGRVLMFCTIWLTLPIQIALYPIAGALGLVPGAALYFGLSGSGMEQDAILDWSWTACFAALLPAMRIETGIEDRVSGYRTLRHLLRLGLFAGAMYYFSAYIRQDPPQTAVISTLAIAVLAHFILRWRFTRGLWNSLQAWLWLRKA